MGNTAIHLVTVVASRRYCVFRDTPVLEAGARTVRCAIHGQHMQARGGEKWEGREGGGGGRRKLSIWEKLFLRCAKLADVLHQETCMRTACFYCSERLIMMIRFILHTNDRLDVGSTDSNATSKTIASKTSAAGRR